MGVGTVSVIGRTGSVIRGTCSVMRGVMGNVTNI